MSIRSGLDSLARRLRSSIRVVRDLTFHWRIFRDVGVSCVVVCVEDNCVAALSILDIVSFLKLSGSALAVFSVAVMTGTGDNPIVQRGS